ncbi:hypothetical protein POM88_007962 [Heracleum sosnowskyi]|uniref:Uncharacterized protein n=1 Tax=Heracleum sosnowskyi TaxID=360622 RepID=A0AAD8J753_9APIA|nr:hypothetical protein POM88_007962 [Heracleum sosnowskyi]
MPAKGVSSLFSDLSPLYDHPGKADILEELALEIERTLKMSGVFPGRLIEPNLLNICIGGIPSSNGLYCLSLSTSCDTNKAEMGCRAVRKRRKDGLAIKFRKGLFI